MKKDPRVYLAHIFQCVEKIQRFTAEGKQRFLAEEMIQDAVVRNLEIIGEAAKRVDEAYRNQHPEIPWRELAGLRDVLIHQYAPPICRGGLREGLGNCYPRFARTSASHCLPLAPSRRTGT